MLRRFMVAVWPAVVLITLGPVSAQGAPATAPARPSISLVGQTAPDVFLTSMDGERVRLSALRGDGVLVVQFFASWCVACREEVPALNRAYAELRDRNLRVVGVNFGETRRGVEKFVSACGDQPPDYPLYVDVDGEGERAFRVVGVPLTVVIGRDGKIAYYGFQLPADTTGALARYLTTGELEKPGGAVGRVAARFEVLLAARSMWVLPVAFVGGLLSVLLPCVYPVIPVAAGFFGAQAGGSKGRAFRLALAYGLGMALLVTVLGLIALGAKTTVGEIASNRWVNLGVGVAILLLSLPVLGVVHLRTPAVLGRAQGKAAGMRGVPAAFLLGLVSGPIVSVCVAPILGAILLAVSVGGAGVGYGTLLIFLYGLGLGTPFIVLGTFAGLLKSLPKPGGWMRVVQVVFGVLLALVGVYFIVVRGILERF